MAIKALSIDDIILDEGNPRLDGAKSQRDILQGLINDDNGKGAEKIAALAESIVANGLSPIDNILVMPAPKGVKGYLALEGNRRAAALKILSNPALLTGLDIVAKTQKKLEALASKFNRQHVEPIHCPVVQRREDSKHWIELKHISQNNGEGVVPWTGMATARYRGEGSTALKVLEFVQSFGDLKPEKVLT